MSETTPPSNPTGIPPEFIPDKIQPAKKPLGRGACAGLGFFLLVASVGLGILFPPAAAIGLVVAFGSLFFEGYRYICVGFVLSFLIIVGLFFLAIIVMCGSGTSHM